MFSFRAILKPRPSPWLLPRSFPTVAVRLYTEGKAGEAGKAGKTEKTEKTEKEKEKRGNKEKAQKDKKDEKGGKGKKEKKRKRSKKPNPSPLDRFFASFPSFPYDPKKFTPRSLEGLRKHLDYDKESPEWKEIYKKYKATLPEEVKTWFSGNQNDIHAWHQLFRVLDIQPEATPAACMKKIKDIHVNIYDLIKSGRNGQKDGSVVPFSSIKDLAIYSFNEDKIYPKDAVSNDKGETNIVLRHLLRHLL